MITCPMITYNRIRSNRRESGQAIIEFAFIITLMAFLALGVVNFALAIQQAMLVQEAATEGALYSSLDNFNTNQYGYSQSSAAAAGAGTTGLTVVASYYCTCAGLSASCTVACSGDRPQMFVQSTATASFSSLFPYSTLPKIFNLSSTVVMPVQ